MTKQSMKCPECGKEIEITEVIAHEIESKLKQQFQSELKIKEQNFRNQLQAKDDEINRIVLEERKRAGEEAKLKAKEEVRLELADLQEQLQDEKRKREALQREEIALRKQQRALEEAKKNLELDLARKLAEESEKIEEATAQRIFEEHRLKDAEKDKKLEDALKRVEELNRKLQQGSQQLQGEVLQIELENLLSSQFPQDRVTQIAKGVNGADILQEVYTQHGRYCGKILWETKRTKNWQEKWLEKLKNDQREAKADVAAIVSETLPKDVKDFRLIGDIWVIDFQFAAFLATTLRAQVIHLSTYKEALAGKGQKEEALYGYITGQPYRERMSAMVESCISMQSKLIKERTVAERNFSEREGDIKKTLASLANMHGDLASVLGTALPAVKNLEIEYLPNSLNISEDAGIRF